MSALRFNAMHFMPYVHLPENHKQFKSTWVNFPNKFYDPARGHELYQRYLAGTGAGGPAWLRRDRGQRAPQHRLQHDGDAESDRRRPRAANQESVKICVWGTPPNFMLPNRLAEEYAILDVMSQGRLEVAFPLGTGMEYWANPVNPATARERFKESLKVILQAWTQDGPTHSLWQVLHLPFPQPMAAALSAASPALLHRRLRQPRDDRNRGRARFRLLVRVRAPAALL